MPSRVEIRPAEAGDAPVLEAMLFEAFFWRPEQARPALADFRDDAEFVKWMRGFGRRAGDGGVVAERDGAPIGAAFYRRFTETEHSYGFVDVDTPELALGVASAARRGGVGRTLMQALIEQARSEGVEALSLSVEIDNPARALYRALGFERIGAVENAWTMRLRLIERVSATSAQEANA